jgi:hypothetical protein
MAVKLDGNGIIGRDTQKNLTLNGDGSVTFESAADGALIRGNNLSDVPDKAAARANLSVPGVDGSGASGSWNIKSTIASSADALNPDNSYTVNRLIATSPNSGSSGGLVIKDAPGNPDAVYLQAVNNEADTQYGFIKFNKDGTIITNRGVLDGGTVKAWGSLFMDPSCVIRAAFNITSLTYVGAGRQNVNFSQNFGIYAAVVGAATGGGTQFERVDEVYATYCVIQGVNGDYLGSGTNNYYLAIIN